MAVKLIALDLDGTTLNSRGKLTEITKKALNTAVDRGVHVVIATGRARCALPEEVIGVKGIEYAVTSNGAAINELNSEKLIYKNCIHPKAVREVYNLLVQYDFMMEVFIKGIAYVEKKVFENLEQYGVTDKRQSYVLETRLPYDGILDLMLENDEYIENVNINFTDQKDKAMMKELLEGVEGITVTSSFDHNLEIGGADTSKASALKELCRILGVEPEEIMACGDSPNDEAMMKIAGIPVAMGNAKKSVKNIACHITGTNDENGVAQAIEKFVFSV